jgi:hypothetical protein
MRIKLDTEKESTSQNPPKEKEAERILEDSVIKIKLR